MTSDDTTDVSARDETAHHHENADVSIDLKNLPPRYLIYGALILILVLGFYVRIYHLDYPVIGFHNWKEVHHLTEARNFAEKGFFAHGFFIPEYDYYQGGTIEGPDGEHPAEFPTTSIVVAILFMIFGQVLWVARLASVIFSVGTIWLIYLVMKRLFGKEYIALTAAALTAIMPVLIFFGRQVQLESYALFFMMLSAYLYILWLEKDSWKMLLAASIALAVCLMTRQDHFPILVGFAAIFPWKRLFEKKMLKQLAVAAISGLFVVGWQLYERWYAQTLGQSGVAEQFNFGLFLDASWRETVWSYIRDNYSALGFWIAIIGFIALVALLLGNKEHKGYRFVFGYCIGFIPWFFLAEVYLSGHAYHQYPVVPLVVFLQCLTIVTAAALLQGMLHIKYVRTLSIVVLVLILFAGIGGAEGTRDSTARLFNTQFPGLDVAGEYIHAHAKVGEKMMHTSGQGYGVMWHADMKGYKLPTDPVDIQQREALGADWMFIYLPFAGSRMQDENFTTYLSENYALKQIGFMQQQQGAQLLYLVYKKGGTSNLTQINDFVANKQVGSKQYEYTTGPYTLMYTK